MAQVQEAQATIPDEEVNEKFVEQLVWEYQTSEKKNDTTKYTIYG